MMMTGQARGFTLIEFVIVIVVIAVLAATASLYTPGDGVNVSAQAEQLASDIRYTQSLAMSRGQRFRLNLTAGSYQITDPNGIAQTHPGTGTSAAVSLGSTVLSGYNPPLNNAYVAFDSLGVPYTDPTTALVAQASLTLTAKGEAISVRVVPQTGRVKVQ